MKQARWTKTGIEVVEVKPPPLESGHARLRVVACGICGSDLHRYRGEQPAPPGSVPAHEVVGTPIDGPASLEDRLYAVEPRYWCGRCELCQSGRRHLCPAGGLLGVDRAGGLAEWMDVPLAGLHPVDPAVTPLVASLAEPLAVCVRALNLAAPATDSRVLVLGAGTVGLLAGLLARDRVGEVAITARHAHQREAARRLGLVALGEDDLEAWSAQAVPGVAIETVGGRADTLDAAIRSTRPGGRVVVLGIFSGSPAIDTLALVLKELSIVGSNTYGMAEGGSEFAAAVELLPRHASELAPLLTHQLPLAKLENAFACADDKSSGAIKVSLEMPRV